MNRRHFLVALAVVVPIAVFIPAKIAASWRPVKIEDLPPEKGLVINNLTASKTLLAIDIASTDPQQGNMTHFRTRLYDRNTGRLSKRRGALLDGGWTWRLSAEGKPNASLILQDPKGHETFQMLPPRNTYRTEEFESVRLSARQSVLEAVARNGFFRWHAGEPRLQRQLTFSDSSIYFQLAPDGKTVLLVKSDGLIFLSTSDGKQTGFVPFNQNAYGWIKLSPRQTYVACGLGFNNPKSWQLMDVATGRVLWQFALDSPDYGPIFSTDETLVALPLATRKIWEVRQTKTGTLVRTLPLVTGARRAAFSPDGATLYSVAGGVLYRQRAR